MDKEAGRLVSYKKKGIMGNNKRIWGQSVR
jgi:hypothetical protein